MADVRVGQVWDFVGKGTDAPPKARGWRCVVLAANDSREAGPDSWVMHCTDTGRPKYMHQRARLAGQWRRLTWWRRLGELIWAGEPWNGRRPATEKGCKADE